MKTIITIILLVTTTLYAEDNSKDAIYTQKLIGEWTQALRQGPMKIDGILNYKKDGILDSTATITNKDQVINMEISGTWEVKKGFLICVIKKKSFNVPMPIGFTSKDQILKITDSIFEYKTKYGKTEIQKKKNKS